MASPNELTTLLTATLNPDGNTRISAELKLKEVLAIPESALSLSRLILGQELDLSLRQHSASIMLRTYVKERWSPYFSTFKGSAPAAEVKTEIRQAVFQGLSDPNRKIRSLSAQTLSLVANCDWPDEYPDLLDSLIALLSTNSPASVHGAMQVFTEFIKSDLSEDQILPVLRQLLPVLLAILGDTEHHTPLTRARTISVFRQCVEALYMVKEMHPQAIKEATASVLPVWLEAFKVLLNIDPREDVSSPEKWDGLAIRIQVFRTLDTLHTTFPRALKAYFMDYLSASLNHLQCYYPFYYEHYVASDSPVPKNSEDESLELPEVAAPILDFVSSVARSGKAREWFEPTAVNALLEAVIGWSQISMESEETWATNADAFINEEGDSGESYSIRVAAFDLLSVLIDRSPVTITTTLGSNIQNIAVDCNALREKGDVHWWRRLEAALAAIGSQSESVMDCTQEEQEAGRPKPIDIEGLLVGVIPSLLGLSDCPFLQGRAFVFASQHAKLFPLELGGQYLDAALRVVEASDAGIPVKVSAIKAIQNFVQNLEGSVLTEFAPRIAKDLSPFMLVTSEDTLLLVLETMSVCIEVESGKWITPDLATSITVAILEVWMKTNKDPMFTSLLSDVLRTLASSRNEGVYESVVKLALPSLCNSVASASDEESWITETAIELISALASGAPDAGLGDGFFAALGPALFKCLKTAEDRDTLQNGVVCLTTIVRKDCRQVLSWADSNGQSGLDHILAVIAKLLESEEEAGSLFIGDLIIHLLRNAGEAVFPVLPGLMRAMVSRMVTAKSDLFMESLLTPFAFLVYKQRDAVLDTLEPMSIDGHSGLEILLSKWCEHTEFQGLWQGRVNVLALVQLYTSERPSVRSAMVRGDMIIKPQTSKVIMTRSRTKQSMEGRITRLQVELTRELSPVPIEFTFVYFPVKAIKIILSDLQSALGNAPTASRTPADDMTTVDSEEEDEDWTEEEKAHQGFTTQEFSALSEMLGPRGVNFDNDDGPVPDEVDFAGDPVLDLDMVAHLVSFLKECATQNTGNFSAVVDQLSTEEILLVQRATA